ncbi:MAG TPA: hypothetical protein VHW47_10250 [Acidimicrobiales bacterium]|jgi:hypothetical protein|nr:hypothetical protein [Acidimicrobiales bacterium]
MTAKVQQPPANLTFQGIVVPGSSLNPKAFFAGTRRQTVLQKTISSWAGFGQTDVVDTLRAGILSGYYVKVSGNLVLTTGSGTIATTSRWPYYLIRNGRFQANGQSNLVAATGWALRAREYMADAEMSDRGVPNNIGGASPGTARTQGTLALNSEAWGVGSNVTGLATQTVDVELSFYVPVAYEKKMLTGAVFCQTLSTTLELDLTWANLSDLFTLTGNATVVFNPQVTIEAEMFTIPSDGQGGMFLPNLSAFHSFIGTRAPNSVSTGNNEITLSGQGVGRQLMRVFWRTMNGTVPAPIIPTATTISQPYWRYGTNTTPETWLDGRDLRQQNERDYGVDLGAYAGYECIDFDRTWAFRDSVDEGSATELRFGYTIPNSVSLTSPFNEYFQDVILAGAAA